MKFKRNDLIINQFDCGVVDVPIGCIVKVTDIDDYFVYFNDTDGIDRERPVENYSLINYSDLNRHLQNAKKELDKAQTKFDLLNEFKTNNQIRVGDKYRFTRQGSSFYGAESIVSEANLDGICYYTAIITDHTKDVGSSWYGLSTDINDVFGSNEEHFEKI